MEQIPLVTTLVGRKKIIREQLKPGVLLVDDTPQNLGVLVALLKDSCDPIVAKSGEKALDILKRGPRKIELILLDVQMPGIDGFETCRQIKANSDTADIPVIFLTAKTEPEAEDEGFAVGGVDFITKPYRHGAILNRVATHIELYRNKIAMAHSSISLRNLLEHKDAEITEQGKNVVNTVYDLKTPLSSIIGYSGLGKDLCAAGDVSPQQLKKIFAGIERAGTVLTTMISDILDCAKIESGQIELEQNDFRIDDVIASVVKFCAFIANKNGNTIEVSSSKNKLIIADYKKVHRILLNLVDNSCKSTKNGMIRIAVLENQTNIVITVADTGCGLTETEQKRVFQRYQQADANSKKTYGGTGLGLALAKNFAELMGGGIDLVSKKNKGSTFSFTLPKKYSKLHQN